MNEVKISRKLVWLMAVATGLSVANLYYNQPLLEILRSWTGVSVKEMGLLPTLTQIGYAFGMLFLVPLGDMFERKKLIVFSTLIVALPLLMMAFAQNYWMLITASFGIGIMTMTPQFIIPFAAHLAPAAQRGRVLGTVVSGLLIGILLSRTLSGVMSGFFGWRSVYLMAAATMLLLAFVLQKYLPQSEPAFRGSYKKLLKSVLVLFVEEPLLRESALIGAMLFAVFSSIWVTLIFLLSSEFAYGAQEAGYFGLLGAAGALAAPLAGRVVDKLNPRWGVLLGIVLTVLSCLLLLLGQHILLAVIVALFFMDLGVQGGHVCNQARIFTLREDARSRVNTVYMFCYFIGGASGSMLGTWAWGWGRMQGLFIIDMIFLSIALFLLIHGAFFSMRKNAAQ